ncbi:hypothetical protein ELUMI_v1c05080 [Williamsoniiplasma luminosum]|uniref:Uncharacterized protein n=1 Tax=Williamsoniiplasma luminosum TaxID=214888 RepID=A0A2K8NTR5_9MOLU|nr:hypothetical protein [Williamsoniiplasma luminosum]ATZ17232.1 hypothetical protein ELUMI_v1c05080 [Williamsoniiplasma luminosum]
MFGFGWDAKQQRKLDQSQVVFKQYEKIYGQGTLWRCDRSRIWLAYLLYKNNPQIPGVDAKFFNYENFHNNVNKKTIYRFDPDWPTSDKMRKVQSGFHSPSGGYLGGGNDEVKVNNYVITPSITVSWYWALKLGTPMYRMGDDMKQIHEAMATGEAMKKFIKSRPDYFALATQMAGIEFKIYDAKLRSIFEAFWEKDYNLYIQEATNILPNIMDLKAFAETANDFGAGLSKQQTLEIFLDDFYGIDAAYFGKGIDIWPPIETTLPLIVEQMSVKQATPEEIAKEKAKSAEREAKVDDFLANIG